MQTIALDSALETAACLWEAVLNMRDNPSTDPDAIARALAIRATCDAVGTASLRLTVVGWTSAVEAAWSPVADHYDACFHWHFVPDWIVRHIDWSDAAHPTIRRQSLLEAGTTLAEPLPSPTTPPTYEPPMGEGD